MKVKNRTVLSALIAALLAAVLSLTACTGQAAKNETAENGAAQTANSQENEAAPAVTNPGDETAPTANAAESAQATDNQADDAAAAITQDREGNPITLPETISKIIAMGPSNTEILSALGFADKIIAADTYSAGLPGLAADLPLFSMMEFDGEQLINLAPDVIFVTGMSKVEGSNPYKVVADAGICVVYIPSSDSIDGIKEDIRFLAAAMKASEQGETIIAEMENEIDQIAQVGASISDRKTVYFEISAAPYMYSFGSGVFLDEMLTLIGADNILADQESWVSVTDETILQQNPEVILTSVNYLDDPTGEILARPGWEEITAVKNNDIHYIDTDSSNRPSHHIVKALKEMAKAVYPDQYQ